MYLQQKYVFYLHIAKAMHLLRKSRIMLSYPDSNRKQQNQNLRCYHYTIAQFAGLSRLPAIPNNSIYGFTSNMA